jgi:two-component system, NarL family, response regulator DesR
MTEIARMVVGGSVLSTSDGLGGSKIRAMIVEDIDPVRGALAAVLSSEEDMEVVAQLAASGDVLAAARAHRPDVTVIDVDRSDPEGLRIPRQLREEQPENQVLVLITQRTAEGLRHVLDAGLRGFLDKYTPPSQLVESVRRVAAGDWVIDPVLAVAALHADENPLSPRQRDVLRLVDAGVPVRGIARQLFLSPGTVRNYMSAAVRKTGTRSLMDAVRHAERAGWL